MLRNTIAVGPCEPRLFWVTGNVGVASHRDCCGDRREGRAGMRGLRLKVVGEVVVRQSRVAGSRRAMFALA